MTGFRDIPFDAVRQVADGVRAASAARRSCVRIAIEVDEGAPAYLVSCVRDAFVPQTSTGLLHIAAFDAGGTVRVNPDCDAAIVLAGTSGAAPGVARAFCAAGVPSAIVVESSVEAPSSLSSAGHRGHRLVVSRVPPGQARRVALALVQGRRLAWRQLPVRPPCGEQAQHWREELAERGHRPPSLWQRGRPSPHDG
mgnify:CR=1 FL=1